MSSEIPTHDCGTESPLDIAAAGVSQVAIDVSVITVSYHCQDDVLRCLASIDAAAAGLSVEVFVVDNASRDGTVESVAKAFPSTVVLENEENLGFSAANNRALARARGNYLLLLNPDAWLEPSSLRQLVGFMKDRPEVGLVGPRTLNPDESLQYSLRNFPSVVNALFEALLLNRVSSGLSARLGEVIYDPRAYESSHPVDWVNGAAMFVRREVLERVGGLDEDFFLYAEEIDWQKRMHDAGVPIWYVSDAVVHHREFNDGQSSRLIGQNIYAREQYWRKHGGRFKAFSARWILGMFLATRLVVWTVRSLWRDEWACKQRAAYGLGLRQLITGSGGLRRTTEP